MNDLELARAAARTAAGVIVGWHGRLTGAEYKGEVDPVTIADRDAEAAITGLIVQHRPGDHILAEEGGDSGGEGTRRWIVDPLDGTVNFLHGVPQVAVSIALEVQGEVVCGVVRDVFRGEEFLVERGSGASRDGSPITVSGCTDLQRALVSTGFGYDSHRRAEEYMRPVTAVLQVAQGVRRNGSAALDLAWVACGRFDAHWEFNLSPWDVAAGFLLVSEAGGTVLGFDGRDPDHRGFVAGTPGVTGAIRDVVSAARTSSGLT